MGRNLLRPYKSKRLGGGFGAEEALEARASELDADEFFALGLGIGDMDDAAVGGEICVVASGAHEAVAIPDAGKGASIPGDRRAIDTPRSIMR
jgi:hypothetical protein